VKVVLVEEMEKIREQFPITNTKAYLAHASRGPIPKAAADAVHEYLDKSMNSGMTLIDAGVPGDGGKKLFAKLICAKKEEIAFIENTSIGLNMAANMLRYPSGSKVVTTDYEYSSVIYPYLRRGLGVKVHYLKNIDGKVLLRDFERAVDDNTAAVVVSHVHWLNGFRYDLRALSEIAHDHGAYLIIDAIQSAGSLKIDVERDDVDFLATSCYKWLLGPPGVGFLYIKQNLIDRFEPPFVGWRSNINVEDRDPRILRLPRTAGRFEVGSPGFISIVGAIEALKLLLNVGIDNIERRVLRLTNLLMEALKDLGLFITTPEEPSYRSGIVNFQIEKPQRVVDMLNKEGIIPCGTNASWARCSPLFYNTMRVAPHFYNTKNEINRFIEVIKKSSS
jgi:selenocysteine lyase/cysteine desulfurase